MPMSIKPSSFAKVFVLVMLLALTGCAQKIIDMSGVPIFYPSPQPDSPLRKADAAWNAANMREAEQLYQRALQSPTLSAGERTMALSRLAEAAMANKHAGTALDALNAWKRLDSTVTSSESWLRLWGRAVMALPPSQAVSQALAVVNAPQEAVPYRASAAGVLLARGQSGDGLMWVQRLTSLYTEAGQKDRVVMERCLVQTCNAMPAGTLVNLLQYTLPDTDGVFPWSILLLEKARREGAQMPSDMHDPALEGTTLGRIFDAVFADSAIIASTLQGGQTQGQTPVAHVSNVPMYAGSYALALPLSGSYSALGNKIALGAKAAQTELNSRGIQTELYIIDTDRADWLNRLNSLPPQCVTVGGPMLPAAFEQAKATQAVRQRAFFTFLTSLGEGEEGRTAWRFFTSPADQIRTMIDFAGRAGVRRFATLYPEDAFGRRMSTMFLQAAPAGGGITSRSYPKGNVSEWNAVTAKFVGSYMIGKVPASSATFEAVFLPDSWNNAALIIPCLFFNGEDRLLIMGTSLWEQGLPGGARLDASNLSLVVFPGAWNAASPPPAARNLNALLAGQGEADLWTGLGYDFVRFAAALHLAPGWTPDRVNNLLRVAQQISWSMAPMVWNGSGRASRHLYVFNPTRDGAQLVTPQEMGQRIKQARTRYDRRIRSGKQAR
ncbi:MAG TPA: penicillin-binding protein activator [Candidatus Avidesulfovibrio excrementigallinarum]|nr:penicillin-binding protein activator [Candidatus Avidesulfovibrio excrementigallinarum]